MQRARFAGSLLTRGVIRVTGADATTFLQVRFVRFVASSVDLDLHSGTDAR
jgi:folate-binding Fe-S cluster repair protein YgfZ